MPSHNTRNQPSSHTSQAGRSSNRQHAAPSNSSQPVSRSSSFASVTHPPIQSAPSLPFIPEDELQREIDEWEQGFRYEIAKENIFIKPGAFSHEEWLRIRQYEKVMLNIQRGAAGDRRLTKATMDDVDFLYRKFLGLNEKMYKERYPRRPAPESLWQRIPAFRYEEHEETSPYYEAPPTPAFSETEATDLLDTDPRYHYSYNSQYERYLSPMPPLSNQPLRRNDSIYSNYAGGIEVLSVPSSSRQKEEMKRRASVFSEAANERRHQQNLARKYSVNVTSLAASDDKFRSAMPLKKAGSSFL